MNKEQFFNKLKENKYFEDYNEHTKYRLGVVQYYLTNYTSRVVINGNMKLLSNLVTIKEPTNDNERRAICHAFNSIRLKLMPK